MTTINNSIYKNYISDAPAEGAISMTALSINLSLGTRDRPTMLHAYLSLLPQALRGIQTFVTQMRCVAGRVRYRVSPPRKGGGSGRDIKLGIHCTILLGPLRALFQHSQVWGTGGR